MMTLIKRWLAPPVFAGDEEKTRRAELLNATMLIVLLFTTLIFVGVLLGGRIPTSSSIINIIILASALLFRHWLFSGKINLVVIGVVVFGTSIITAAIASLGTIRSPVTATYLFVVIIAGILYGMRGILVTTFASSLAVAVLIIAENAGMLPPPDYTVTITQWTTYTILFGLAGYLAYFSYQTIFETLKRTQMEIEERKRTEEALRESETRWQFALEGSGDGLWDWNVQTGDVYFSQRWKTVLGYEPDEISDRLEEWDKRVHPEDRERVYADINKHFEEQTEIYASEHRLQCKDGSYKWMLDRGKVISRTPDGKPLRVIGTHTDITERKNTLEALRESEARFRSLFDQTHDAVFILDLQGRQLAANQRAADMLGYTMNELLGLTIEEMSADLEESQQVIEKLLTGEHTPLYERRLRRKDGQILPVEINVELVRDSNGNPLHIQSVVRDISKRKRAQAAITAANEQLNLRVAEVERLQEELREQVLHDPLTGLYNRRYLAEMLEHEIARTERERESLSIIVSDIDHFKVINDTYGHQAGDRFLVEIADLLKRFTRSSDLICRYGGEEFVLVFPGAAGDSAVQRAEEIRQKCAEVIIQHEGKDLSVTMSFGLAIYPDHGKSAEEIIIKADKALYISKQTGRNRVTVWTNGQP
jgi:diguanylate cyclase (GGDEF)-like protein/PAS domain S-box-containing protein